MSFYPESVETIIANLKPRGRVTDPNTEFTASDFTCGAFVRISLKIDPVRKVILKVDFRSNSCGYGLAAAAILTRELAGKHLSELGGLKHASLVELLKSNSLHSGARRSHCEDTAIEAVRGAFALCRDRQLSSFNGDDPLICTCFGVSESTIEKAIEMHGLRSVDAVSDVCRAGLGCGSCRMLIQEIIDHVSGP